MKPVAVGNGADTACFCGQGVPGVAGGVNDSVVGIEDTASEKVLTEVLPDIFLGIEFWTIGRQFQQGYIGRDDQLAAFEMPAWAVNDNDGMDACGNFLGNGRQMHIHHRDIDLWQNKSDAFVA